MTTHSQPIYFNKSAYVALICLIAFVIVITICVIKQFIRDPSLAKRFEIIRPVISQSVRKLSSSFYRPSTTTTATLINPSLSDICITTHDPPALSNENMITLSQNSCSTQPINRTFSQRSYGSSSSSYTYAYINHGSDDFTETPVLHFSCEYNPSAMNVKLNIEYIRQMNIFHSVIDSNAFISIRCFLPVTNQTFETQIRSYEDFIRFDQTFVILNRIHPGDRLNYEIRFFLTILVQNHSYEIAEGVYSLEDDCLTFILFVERTIDMNLKLIEN